MPASRGFERPRARASRGGRAGCRRGTTRVLAGLGEDGERHEGGASRAGEGEGRARVSGAKLVVLESWGAKLEWCKPKGSADAEFEGLSSRC